LLRNYQGFGEFMGNLWNTLGILLLLSIEISKKPSRLSLEKKSRVKKLFLKTKWKKCLRRRQWQRRGEK